MSVNIHMTIPQEEYNRIREESTQRYCEGQSWEFSVVQATLFVRTDGTPRVAIYRENSRIEDELLRMSLDKKEE